MPAILDKSRLKANLAAAKWVVGSPKPRVTEKGAIAASLRTGHAATVDDVRSIIRTIMGKSDDAPNRAELNAKTFARRILLEQTTAQERYTATELRRLVWTASPEGSYSYKGLCAAVANAVSGMAEFQYGGRRGWRRVG